MRKTPGMEAAVRSKITPLEGMSLVNSTGKPYGIMKASGDPDQQSLISEYEIFRGDLAQVLFDLTKDNQNIKYVFGEQVVSMTQNGDGPITVEFANILENAEYDLVVSCDGAHSRTRAIGMNYGVRDHVIPLNTWVAYFSIKEDLLNGSKIGHAFSAVGGRWMAVGPDPAGGNRVTLMGISPRNNHDATLPFREAVKKGDYALKSYIAQKFKGAGWIADAIIKGMLESDDFYATESVQVKGPTLYNGRFVLVGEAGYAPGPTGTGK
jgi:2-polyprenyl-6-methoxyphenol hydroxylase-like FAD-dependent oxidoreductase